MAEDIKITGIKFIDSGAYKVWRESLLEYKEYVGGFGSDLYKAHNVINQLILHFFAHRDLTPHEMYDWLIKHNKTEDNAMGVFVFTVLKTGQIPEKI